MVYLIFLLVKNDRYNKLKFAHFPWLAIQLFQPLLFKYDFLSIKKSLQEVSSFIYSDNTSVIQER